MARLDSDIDERVSDCQVCASVSKLALKAPLHPWKWSVKPWKRIIIDSFGQDKYTFDIVVDAYSNNWLEVVDPMTGHQQFANTWPTVGY